MNVIILGIARSGTSLLYSLLQHALSAQFPDSTDFYYEPFLRRFDCFNHLYEELGGSFRTVESLSFEGIAAHLRLPLFMDTQPSCTDPYLQTLFHGTSKNPHQLMKFIRASGRIGLLHQLAPKARFVVLIRNPVDVVNSIMRLFSFFGGEFHWDDYPRFLSEASARGILPFPLSGNACEVERDVAYWYAMNTHLLAYAKAHPDHCMALCYEDLVSGQEEPFADLSAFLDLEIPQAVRKRLQKPVGPVTRSFSLSAHEHRILSEQVDTYLNMVRTLGLRNPASKSAILGKYELSERQEKRDRPFYGLHTRSLQREYAIILKQKDAQIRDLETRLKRQELKKG